MADPAAARGYADGAYARSLAEWGTPRRLAASGGWILARPVPGTGLRDAMGPYPLLACEDWAALPGDVAALEGALVSLVAVADPLGAPDDEELRRAFPDLVRPFKRHFVCDLAAPEDLPRHHRRRLARAGRAVEVEVCPDPPALLDAWEELYAGLVARHDLRGIRAFSREAFARQLALDGLVAVRAVRDGATACLTLWLVSGSHAHYHLGASSAEGYATGASYAVFAAALAHLRDRGVRWADLGGSAGGVAADDGLARFKAGWASGHRDARLCGRVLDRAAYAELCARRAAPDGWFPAYRAGEGDLDAAGDAAPRALAR